MGALETLYSLVYGGGLSGGSSDMARYILEKLYKNKQKYIEEAESRSSGPNTKGMSFDEYEFQYLKPDDVEFTYSRHTGKPLRDEDIYTFYGDRDIDITPTLNKLKELENSGEMVPSHISGIGMVPSHVYGVDDSVRRGEMVPSHGGSPYKEADKMSAGERAVEAYKNAKKYGDYTDFSSFMADYVRRAERDTAAADAAEAERIANSVNIDIPGGYESLQRIRQQAGGTPGGGSFSAMESTVKGGDTEESLRAYVDNYRNTEVDRQIGLIEQAFPAANRPPALDARLQTLYEARANRDMQETARKRLPIDQYTAETERKAAEGLYEYHTNYGPTQKYVADKGVEEARITAGAKEQSDMRYYFDDLLQRVREAAKTNPAMDAALPKITAIAYDSKLSWDEKNKKIEDVLRGASVGSSGTVDLSEREALLFNKPGG